jgi:O-antigen ligase
LLNTAPLSGVGKWPRVSWTSSAGTLRFACFLAWLVLLVRPIDVPDPFALGLSGSWTAVCLAVAAIVWLPELLTGRWSFTAIDRMLGLYLAVVVLTSINMLGERVTMTAVLQLLGNVGVFYATVVLARKEPRLSEGILLLLVASIALLLLMALAYHAELGLLTRPAVYPVPEGWSGYPELSMLAVVQCGLLIAGLLSVSSRLMFPVTAALVLMNLVELVFLYSRSSWVTVGLIFAAACVTARRSQLARLLATVAVVIAAGVVLFLANPTIRYLTARAISRDVAPVWARSLAVTGVANSDMRIQIWRRTLRMIADHPVRGVGLGNFQEVFESRYNTEINDDLRRGVHAHNLWLQQFAELGLLGGALYVALWIRIVALCWRSARTRPDFLSLGLLLSIVGIVGSNLTTNMFFLTGGASGRLQSLTWMLFGLAVTVPHRVVEPDHSSLVRGIRL